MAISRDTKQHLEKADFDSLEADWIGHLAEDPGDLDYAVGVIRALTGYQEEERARFLLEIWDEELKAQGLWRIRLDLLKRTGTLLHGSDELHQQIERTLEGLYPEHTTFSGLVELSGLHRAVEDVDKLWAKTDRLVKMLQFDAGSIVAMEGRGVARVVDVNLQLKSFRLDFGSGAPLTVGFRAADKMLELLPPEHMLRMKLEQPEELTRLVDEDPAELLRRVLVSHDKPMTAGEIREALDGIVAEGKWSSWWNGVRKHPQVLHESKGRGAYSWAETSEDAEANVWKRFEDSAPREQIDLFRRNTDRSDELSARMADRLLAEIERTRSSDASLALEISLALKKVGGVDIPDGLTPSDLLASAADVPNALLGIEDRATRESAYQMLPKTGDGWADFADELLRREDDPRSVSVLADLLFDAEPERRERLLDEALSQPRKVPGAFLWLIERAREDAEIRNRSPLRLIKQLLAALEWKEFKATRASLVKELDSGGTVARLLQHLDSEQAPKVIDALKRAPIEDYQRTPLINTLQLKFDELAPERESPLYALAASIQAKRQEMKELKEVEIPQNRTAIQEARELGDLRENFEYKAARQRHEYLASRLAALDHDLSRARPIDLSTLDTSEIRVGCRISLRSDDGSERELTILGPWESDPDAGILSHESELAQKLIGKKPGEVVELPEGEYRVTGIRASELPD